MSMTLVTPDMSTGETSALLLAFPENEEEQQNW
jgi:hypothetical protein